MYCYALFVMTGNEQGVVDEILHRWDTTNIKPFVPMYDTMFRKSGKPYLEKQRAMPGYVLIESSMPGQMFYLFIRDFIRSSAKSLKLLRNGRDYFDECFVMDGYEYIMLKRLLNADHCVEMSKGVIEGSLAKIVNGPLVGCEGLIKRVNRHKMQATIDVGLMGATRELTVGLEIVERLS